jgi:hypothetical protein
VGTARWTKYQWRHPGEVLKRRIEAWEFGRRLRHHVEPRGDTGEAHGDAASKFKQTESVRPVPHQNVWWPGWRDGHADIVAAACAAIVVGTRAHKRLFHQAQTRVKETPSLNRSDSWNGAIRERGSRRLQAISA